MDTAALDLLNELTEVVNSRAARLDPKESLNRFFRDRDAGIEVVDLRFRQREVWRHFQTDHAGNRDLWFGDQWKPRRDGSVAVLLRWGRRRLGVLHVRAVEGHDLPRPLVMATARELARAADDVLLKAMVATCKEDNAAASERERFLIQVGRQAVAVRTPSSPEVVAELVEVGTDLRRAATVVSLMPSRAKSLDRSLLELAQLVDAGGMGTSDGVFTLRGKRRALRPALKHLLFRFAAGALLDACGPGRASFVHLALTFRRDSALLEVLDNGVDLDRRPPPEKCYRSGPAAELAEAGGTVQIEDVRATKGNDGVVVSVSVPLR